MSASPERGDPGRSTPEEVVGEAAFGAAQRFMDQLEGSHGAPFSSSDALQRSPAAAALAQPAIAVQYDRKLLSKGEMLYLQGDPASSAYLIESGLVALSLAARPGRERVIGLAGPGDLIGVHSAGQSCYLDNAAALSQEVSVLGLHGAAYASDRADVAALLREASLRHLERLTQQLEDTEVPVPARVARTFLRLADRFGQANDSGAIRLTLPLTHDTLAAMVGAARETTSATIEQLRRLGLVTGTRGRYVVQRLPLQEFAAQAAITS